MKKSVIRRIEHSTRGEAAIDGIQKVATKVIDRKPLPTLLSGKLIGHPAHPLAVQIPSGLWLSAVALDLLGHRSGRRTAKRLIGMGIASSLPAILTGLAEWIHTRDAERRVGAIHAVGNMAAIVAMGFSWKARIANDSKGKASALFALAFLGASGWLGGHLVYARGVGVDTTPFQPVPSDWTDIEDRN